MLRELALRSKAHWGYPSELIDAWRERCPVNAAYLAAYQLHVFECDAAVAGFFSFVQRDGRVWLEHFWLDPAYIGRGLGRQMWHTAIDVGGRSGNVSFEIEADPNAAGFYEAMGAVRTGAISSSLDARRLLPLLRFHRHLRPRQAPPSQPAQGLCGVCASR